MTAFLSSGIPSSKSLSLKSGLGDTQTHLLYNKLTQKWITELNGKQKMIKLQEKKQEKNLQDLGLGRVLRLDPKSTIHKEKLYTKIITKFHQLLEDEMTSYRIEYICKSHSEKRISI